MQYSSLKNLENEIKQVKEYLFHVSISNDLATFKNLPFIGGKFKNTFDEFRNHFVSFNVDKRVFEYKACIISLYGLLERTIEKWIQQYLEELTQIVQTYNQLDPYITSKHFELSLKLVDLILKQQTNKFQHLTKEQVINNLYGCLNAIDNNYILNTDAFLIPSGNLKHEKIVELFRLVNVKLKEGLEKDEELKLYFKEEMAIDNLVEVKPEVLFQIVNDLVERRNEIAHGSEKIASLLSIDETRKYVDFLLKYLKAIFNVLNEKHFESESVHQHYKIEVKHKVWKHHILGFELENRKMQKGEIIIIKNSEDKFIKTPILELQIDNNAHDIIEVTGKTNVAIRVEPIITVNCEFFLQKNKLTPTTTSLVPAPSLAEDGM